MKVLAPGNRGAEGKEKGKGIVARRGLEEARSKSAGRRTGTGYEVWYTWNSLARDGEVQPDCIRNSALPHSGYNLYRWTDEWGASVTEVRVPARGNPLDPSARLVSEAVAELGWNVDPKALAERVRQLQQGLPAEDEFALLLSWLGKCALVHRLDQQQIPPDSKGTWRVPDMLAVFRYKDREIPTLIEVKTSAEPELSWRSDYYEAMRHYADLLGLPLLLAWNWTKFGFWTLCDTALFERPKNNYHLAYETAMRHSLMCELAGDFHYVFKPGVGLHFKFEKLEKIPPKNPPAETWHLRIQEAYFTDANGAHLKTLGPGIWWMFIGAVQETETDNHPGYFNYRFVMTEDSPMQAAHRLLPLVTVGLGADQAVPWRRLIEEHSFVIDGATLATEARAAIDRNIVRYVFHLQPADLPAFLK